MLYILNTCNKIIYLGDVMLLPDEKTPDEYGYGKHFSEAEAVQCLMRKGMLELVDVQESPENSEPAAEPSIRVVYE